MAQKTPNREKLIQQLKKRKDTDELFHSAHDEVFSRTDCLTCANCCKTTGPLVTESDITRISQKLKLKESEFISKYLKKDPDDGQWMMNQLPCPFLLPDNYCSIYEFRPKACREYPHTDRKKMHQILQLTAKNASVCPAVEEIWQVVAGKVER